MQKQETVIEAARKFIQAKQAERHNTAVDLLGNRIYSEGTPHKQPSLFDKTDFIRTRRGIPAIIRRDNGEQANGEIGTNTTKGLYQFTEQKTGKTYPIPARHCSIHWAGNTAIIEISETELTRRVSLYGIFASCCLF